MLVIAEENQAPRNERLFTSARVSSLWITTQQALQKEEEKEKTGSEIESGGFGYGTLHQERSLPADPLISEDFPEPGKVAARLLSCPTSFLEFARTGSCASVSSVCYVEMCTISRVIEP